jgi:hypothetical protein
MHSSETLMVIIHLMMKKISILRRDFFLHIFKNEHINHCKNESHKGGKSGLETEMGDDRKSLEESICLNDERSKPHSSKKCINIK